MFELTEEALKLLMDKFVESLKKQIATEQFPYAPGYNGGGTTRGKSNKIATSNLYNSIKGKIIQTPDGPMAEIEYADYFKYVNETWHSPYRKTYTSMVLSLPIFMIKD